jgi:pyridoxal phosphate enzyme (YggS family)
VTLAQRLQALQTEIEACSAPSQHIQLVAVTKTATLLQMQDIYALGVHDFGENRIQAIDEKQAWLPSVMRQKIRWHFIGHLQRNKVIRTRYNRFELIHSVDSVALAQKLSQMNVADNTQQRVLLQVNITREPQKTGFSPEDLMAEFPRLLAFSGINIQGLMAIGVQGGDAQALFSAVRDLRDTLSNVWTYPLPELSMGMSRDVDHAVRCGATIIRIGHRLFDG